MKVMNDSEKEKGTKGEDLKSSLNFTKTATDKLAVLVINLFGSMLFLLCCLIVFSAWICWNMNLIPGLKPFDPFPFSTLEMSVSIFAIILSVSVLINQNRQGRIEKIREQVEFEVNVRAEHEITKMMTLIHEMHQKMGLSARDDRELEEMKEKTDIGEIQQHVDEKQSEADSLTSDKN